MLMRHYLSKGNKNCLTQLFLNNVLTKPFFTNQFDETTVISYDYYLNVL